MSKFDQQPEIPTCEKCKTRNSSIFKTLTPEEQEKFSEDKGCNFYKRGQILFTEGGKPAGIFCIHQGKIKTYKPGNSGREQIISVSGPGDVLGYGALITNESYNASASALEDSVVCFIPKKAFNESIDKNEKLHDRVKTILCQDVKEAEKQMVKISQKQVKARVAETLLVLKHKFGLKEDGETLDVNLTREEFAGIVGTATESVIRLLSGFQKENIIELQNRSIKIKNASELSKRADLPI